jgi:hypothetical protein
LFCVSSLRVKEKPISVAGALRWRQSGDIWLILLIRRLSAKRAQPSEKTETGERRAAEGVWGNRGMIGIPNLFI